MGKFEDVSGVQFGFLIAIKKVSSNRHGTKWEFLCTRCGNKVVRYLYRIKQGSTKSCGCYRG